MYFLHGASFLLIFSSIMQFLIYFGTLPKKNWSISHNLIVDENYKIFNKIQLPELKRFVKNN